LRNCLKLSNSQLGEGFVELCLHYLYVAAIVMPLLAYTGEGGNMQSGCDVCGSVCLCFMIMSMTGVKEGTLTQLL